MKLFLFAMTSSFPAGNDLADPPDAVVTMADITERTVFSSSRVTDAYRFWFDNPSLDYGYALSVLPSATVEAKFEKCKAGNRCCRAAFDFDLAVQRLHGVGIDLAGQHVDRLAERREPGQRIGTG